ncbi:hypothetical protein ACS0TY_002653 [Phlomoides rotata]
MESEPGKADSAYIRPSSKEKFHQGEPPQGFQASKPDESEQPNTSGVKEGETSLRPQKGPKRVDINVAGFWEISKLPDWVLNAVVEYWHNNPYLKRGDELEIKFIIVASKDTTNAIQYPRFHFMKLQRPDKKAFTYIKEQETKSELVVNLTEDEISTKRVWGVWICLTEMNKVKYPFKIYQNLVNGSFLLNSMTRSTTRFANDMFE